MSTPETSNATFAAACALVRAGASGDEDALRALVDTRDRDDLVQLTLAVGALAQILGLVVHQGDAQALDNHLLQILHNQQQ
ncbi:MULTISPECIES: hypothetical protein [unclassified Streptomyces]|uniref:hypothetical protein n=1 Tax=unclassified Streptomyces TaxID=2593676 RepID=UPI003BB62474